ncbi:DUF2746 domain-containing protein [Mycobacterium canetti]|uniref:DUF2746 domain-containing protein n=1 Tax=Mycobacterium canetti TaxID=78331 RepID=UPI00034CE576|nr:DUF2746 domain-containing protein [Mycobacterium canetti]
MNALPTSWIALAGLALILVHQVWQSRQARLTQQTVRQVETQVSNGGTNLAEVVAEMSRDIRGIREDIGGLRSEVRDERQARIEDVGRLEKAIRGD